jgi:ubiquinone/menaquinone biosynthesis C-methylase UbiE
MLEKDIEKFWNNNPCGEELINQDINQNYIKFFNKYDEYRYSTEKHILNELDNIDFKDKKVLEIGLGQGADAEQIIKRGGIYYGLDLTEESINRVKLRFKIKSLPFSAIKKGSVLNIPYYDSHFDIIYSHGVLHHVPEVKKANEEIERVLKKNGFLVIMLYAKYSLNYFISIGLIRRVGLVFSYFFYYNKETKIGKHIRNAKKMGLLNYMNMKNFIHKNTDGPENIYSKVYRRKTVSEDFYKFKIKKIYKKFLHAPFFPILILPSILEKFLGWHLWVKMEKREFVD